MSQVERLIKTRQQLRDEATSELAKAKDRLEAAESTEEELTQEARQQLEQAAQNALLTPAMLESMDQARQLAARATQLNQEQVDQAKQAALESYRLLRQAEILRERINERKEKEQQIKERKQLDEIASRLGRKLYYLVLVLVITASANACKKHDEAEETLAGETETTETDGGLGSAVELNKDERALLEKLRERNRLAQTLGEEQSRLKEEEEKLAASRAELDALHKQTAATRAEVQQLQDQLAGRVSGATATTPPMSMAQATAPAVAPTSAPKSPSIKEPLEAEELAKLDKAELVKVLREMNTRAASAMLAEMDPQIAASAMRELTSREAARLLAMMPPDRAAILGERLHIKPAGGKSSGIDAGVVVTRTSDGGATSPTGKKEKDASMATP